MRAAHHIGRAKLLIDCLRQKEVIVGTGGTMLATSLLVASDELDQAATVLYGTAMPRYWQRLGRAIEFGDGLFEEDWGTQRQAR